MANFWIISCSCCLQLVGVYLSPGPCAIKRVWKESDVGFVGGRTIDSRSGRALLDQVLPNHQTRIWRQFGTGAVVAVFVTLAFPARTPPAAMILESWRSTPSRDRSNLSFATTKPPIIIFLHQTINSRFDMIARVRPIGTFRCETRTIIKGYYILLQLICVHRAPDMSEGSYKSIRYILRATSPILVLFQRTSPPHVSVRSRFVLQSVHVCYLPPHLRQRD